MLGLAEQHGCFRVLLALNSSQALPRFPYLLESLVRGIKAGKQAFSERRELAGSKWRGGVERPILALNQRQQFLAERKVLTQIAEAGRIKRYGVFTRGVLLAGRRKVWVACLA